MKGKILRRILTGWLLVAALASRALGQGTILWDEPVQGAFSQDFRLPTSLSPFQAGTHSIVGTTTAEPVGNNWSVHPDFFILTVPDNLVISGIQLQIDKSNVWAWLGDITFFNQLAFAGRPTSGDLLSQWNLNAIWPGSYGVYMSNNDLQPYSSVANYRLDFVVQVIPEPASLWLLLGGLGCLGIHRWRKVRPASG